MSKVSVIIPAYNRADKIEKSIYSVLNQSYEDLTLIVVDDCSKDNTEEVVRRICDKRLIYHKLSENKGAAGARNAGVKLSESEYIAFQDSDDEWVPDKLQIQMDYISAHPEYAMVYGKMKFFSSSETFVFPDKVILSELDGNIYSKLLRRNSVGCPTMLLKKSIFDKVGGFDESLRCLEDWEFVLRFSENNLIGYIDEVLINSYISENSVSGNVAKYFETRCKMIAQHYQKVQELGLFDAVVMDLFTKAEEMSVLPQVQKMLMNTLAG